MPLGNPISLTRNVAQREIRELAAEDQTLFTVNGGYMVNQIDVYRNGVLLNMNDDYTAEDGSTVTLIAQCVAGDEIVFRIYDTFKVADAIVSAASTQVLDGDLVVTGDLYVNSTLFGPTALSTSVIAQENSSAEITDTGANGTFQVTVDTLKRFTVKGDNVGIASTDPQGFGNGVPTLELHGTNAGFPSRAGAIAFNAAIEDQGYAAIYSEDGGLEVWTGEDRTGGTLTEKVTVVQSGSVGIGTTQPKTALDVDGTATVTTLIAGADPNDGNNAGVKLLNTGIIQAGRPSGSPTSAVFMGFVEGDSSANSRINADGSGFYMGKIGIGTDDPDVFSDDADDLVVAGTGNQGITIRSGATNTGNIFFADAAVDNRNNGVLQYNQNTKEMRFQNFGGGSEFFTFFTANEERVRITSTGQVGINTTDINASRLVEIQQPSDDDSAIRILPTFGTFGNPAYYEIFSGISNYRVGCKNSIDKFFIERSNAPLVTIDGSGDVGIGTTVPLGQLHVQSGLATVTSVQASGSQLVLENNTNTGLTILSANDSLGAILFGDEQDNDIGRIRYEHNTNQFSINVGDRLGTQVSNQIMSWFGENQGTTTLRITGGPAINASIGSTISVIDFQSRDASVTAPDRIAGQIRSFNDNANGALTGLSFSVQDATRAAGDRLFEAMRISSDGDITMKSDLIMDNASADIMMNPGSNSGSIVINRAGRLTTNVDQSGNSNVAGASGGGAQIDMSSNQGIKFSTFPNTISVGDAITLSERMRITSAGKVGIGTDDPLRIFEVFSTGHATAAIKGDTQSSLFFVDSADSNIGQISYLHGDNDMYFRVNDAERMRIDSNGDVGIGTDDPDTQLEVLGPTAEIKITSTNLNQGSVLTFSNENVTSADFLLGQLQGEWEGNDVAYINFEAGVDTANKDDGVITMLTSNAASTPAERMRIDQLGGVTWGGRTANTTGFQQGRRQTLADSASMSIEIPNNTFVGTLYAVNTVTAAAGVRTVGTFFVTGRLDDGVTITSINSANGSGGGATFTISDSSSAGVNNVISFTNTSGNACTCSMYFVGGIGF